MASLQDITDWTPIYTKTDGKGGVETVSLDNVEKSRYLKITINESGNPSWLAASIYEWEIYNFSDQYIIDSGTSEIGSYKVPRYPTEDFTVPLSTKNGATVTWKSNNSAISIDETTGKATVTIPSDADSIGTIVATIAYAGITNDVTFNSTVYKKDNQLTEYKIYPIPQKLTRSGIKTKLTQNINIVTDSSIDQYTKDRAKEVLEKNGYTVTFADKLSDKESNMILKVYADGDENTYSIPIEALSKQEGGIIGEWNVYDAHVVKVNANNENNGDILVCGKQNNAVYYGLATVEQILEQAEPENKVTAVTIEDFSNSQYRGIIEGFYGYAYTIDNIESLLEFGKRYKMNCFLYGPKVDPYHLGKWKSEYPTTLTDEQRANGMLTQDDIKKIVEMSNKNHIEFVWSIHPMMEDGIDIKSSAAVTQGVKDILAKFNMMYNLGVRQFGLFVDDISTGLAVENSEAQARLISEVTSGFKNAHPDTFKPLFYVPTLYSFDAVGNEEDRIKNFSALSSISNFDDIIFTFTGYGVFSSINNDEMKKMANYIDNKQKPTFWWNSPVNDNTDNNLYLGPLDMRYNVDTDVKDSRGMMTNPMNQAEASKISLFGMLDYSWNTEEFDSMQNWDDSFSEIFSDDAVMAKNFKIFAQHNSPNAFIGEKNSVNYSGVEKIIAEIKKEGGKTPENLNALQKNMQELKDACTYLRNNLKGSSNKKYANLYKESEAWINKCYTIADIYIKSLDIELGKTSSLKTYYDASYDYSRISIDPEFYITSLEGAGTEVYTMKQEVYTGGKVLVNYIPTVLKWAREKIESKLPEFSPDLNPSLILEMADKNGVTMSEETNDGYIISGLKEKTLKPGQYIGISMPELVSIEQVEQLNNSLPDGLVLQYSTNGKTWYTYNIGGTNSEMSCFRIFNISSKDVIFQNDTVTIGAHSMLAIGISAEATMGQYQNNSVQNVYDGDWSTSYWSSGSPKVGTSMQINYKKPFQMQSLQMVFDTGDNLDEQAVIEVSSDGKTWNKIATLNGTGNIQADIIKKDGVNYQVFNITGINVNIQHIRMTIEKIITVGYSNWMKCYEVLPNGGKTVPLATVSAGRGATNVIDNNVDSAFIPLNGEDANLTYKLLEPTKIASFEIYMKPGNTLPKAEVKCGNSWKEVSMVQNTDADMPYLYKIDVNNIINLSDIRFSWTKDNAPKTIYDIYYRLGENTSVWPDKTNLIQLYNKAISAKESDYSNTSWQTLQSMLKDVLDLINFQSTEKEVSDTISKLQAAVDNIIKEEPNPDPEPEKPLKPKLPSNSGGGGSSSKAAIISNNNNLVNKETQEKINNNSTFVKKDLTLDIIKLPEVSNKENNFNDINNYSWANSSISKLYSAGIITGQENSKFNPNGLTKRADFMIMIIKTVGIDGTANTNFNDVNPNSYYANYVGLAKEYGIISGTGNNLFNPESTISRQDTMVIIGNILKSAGVNVNNDISVLNKFTDVSEISEYAKENAAILVNLGIVTGTGNKIEAKSNITRAQMSVIVSKLYDVLNDNISSKKMENEMDTEETTLNN